MNKSISDYLTSGVSLRRTSRKLGCHYLTVYRKILWMSQRSEEHHKQQIFNIKELQFDEMESIEHTKLKPLTIGLAISEDFKILGVNVGTIPAKGHLSQTSVKKYGFRDNQSDLVIDELLKNLKVLPIEKNFVIKSDAKPSYQKFANKYYPKNQHLIYVAKDNKEKRREMKYANQEKKIFDPLFAVNQRMAKFRDHIKRLTQRSWCSTKNMGNLEKQIYLYIADNNGYLLV